jgi:hypothetical protein
VPLFVNKSLALNLKVVENVITVSLHTVFQLFAVS